MHNKAHMGMILAGAAAGAINGLFGAGGGMILVPLLSLLAELQEDSVFPASISIIAPICLVSLISAALTGTIAWQMSIPYLLGSTFGGLAAGLWGKNIPVKWLHRSLGLMILWGGIRYLC